MGTKKKIKIIIISSFFLMCFPIFCEEQKVYSEIKTINSSNLIQKSCNFASDLEAIETNLTFYFDSSDNLRKVVFSEYDCASGDYEFSYTDYYFNNKLCYRFYKHREGSQIHFGNLTLIDTNYKFESYFYNGSKLEKIKYYDILSKIRYKNESSEYLYSNPFDSGYGERKIDLTNLKSKGELHSFEIKKDCYHVINASGVNLRSGPNFKSEIVSKLTDMPIMPYDLVKIVDFGDEEEVNPYGKNQWIKVDYEGVRAWIFGQFVEPNNYKISP